MSGIFWKEYHIADTVQQAVELLEQHKGSAIIMGGGTDLVPQYRNNAKSFECLVDITRIEEMRKIEMVDGNIEIGGAVTHAMVASSPIIQKYAKALALGSGIVGSPQIRNVATLAGNIVNAQPAADGAVALIALDAHTHTHAAGGTGNVEPVCEQYLGVGQCKIDSKQEIIEKMVFKPLDPERGEASAVQRLALRKMLSLPMVNVAVAVKVVDGAFEWVRIAIGPMAQRPLRPYDIEAEMAGKPANMETIEKAARDLGNFVTPRNSALRGSAEYRKSMANVLTRRALEDAVSQVTQ